METTVIDLRSLFGLLRRRLSLVLWSLAVCLGLACVVLLALKPVYTATALVLVDPRNKDLLDPDAQLSATGSDSLRVDSEVELVKADGVLAAVTQQLELAADPEFAAAPGMRNWLSTAVGLAAPAPPGSQAAVQVALGNLRSAVSVQRRGFTFLIAINAQSARPEQAAAIANAVAETYIRQQLDAKVAATLTARDAIQSRILAASQAVTASESAFDRFIDGNLDPIARAGAVADLPLLRAELKSLAHGGVPPATMAQVLSPDALTAFYELQQNATLSRAGYQTLLARQNELDTQAFLQVADSRIVSPATPPSTPSSPHPQLILLLAVLAGGAIGLALVLLYENVFGGFTSEPQAEALLKVPVASIPRLRGNRRSEEDGGSVADALLTEPLSPFSESIRRVRIRIDQLVRRARGEVPGEGRVLVVTSAAQGEGKTALALSLARAYAASGLSTLLVDCDLRRPSIHRQLGLEPSGGLFEYLTDDTGQLPLQSILAVDDASGAQVIVGSRRSDIATDQLIAGQTLTRLLSTARGNFDAVILDTPPVGSVVDGLYLAGLADAIVVAVRWSGTPQQEVRSAVSALFAAKAESTPMLVVLNQQGTGSRAYRVRQPTALAET